MPDKKIVFLLTSAQEYIKHTGDDEKKYAAQMNIVFEAISETYIPLIKMFENLESDNIPFKVALVLSPVLCTLLDDSVVQDQYIKWLDNRIELGKKELERCATSTKYIDAVRFCFEKAQSDKEDFLRYDQKILKKIREYHKKGYIELLATCGTNVYLPHYSDIVEILNAQVEAGLYSHKYFFGEAPDGFWLPELGYAAGFEKVLHSYGLNYTVLDTRSFLFSEEEPQKGIFAPARFKNSLAVFGRDGDSDNQIFGEDGYSFNEVYRNNNRDIGFELTLADLEPCVESGCSRYSLGYKYWSSSEDDVDAPYNFKDAFAQTKQDALEFLQSKNNKLSQAAELLPDSKEVSLICSIDLDKLRFNWFEGINWIENVFRVNNEAGFGITFEKSKDLIGNQFALQKIKPYYGSANGTGYGEDLLSSKNSWLVRYVRKASQRMVDLAERFPSDTGLKARLLNMGAKELMIAQSVGWKKMLNSSYFPEYAEQMFTESIIDFTAVFDALGSNTVSTEWLTNLENKHALFPWMNYRIFSRKH